MCLTMNSNGKFSGKKQGDSLARYLVRLSEMTESIKIIQQALERLPGVPYENLETECERLPFDLPEAEEELIAGYQTEYSDLPVVDWKLETNIRKKRLLNYNIDFGICIFCGNCVEYCPTNCLSMTEEYEFSTYDRHELNYNQIALGRLPMSVIDDYTIRTILNSPQTKNG
ncbi:unnamed protein product [Brassica oleracea]